MKKIASFTVNHIDLLRGIYVSRKDYCGDDCITTFDIRMKEPNREPVLNTAESHTLEHLGATYLRNDPERSDQIVYFGPMGCRTGFYMLLRDTVSKEDAIALVRNSFAFIRDFEGEVPGTEPAECGNYLEHDLEGAKTAAIDMLEVLKDWTVGDMKYEA